MKKMLSGPRIPKISESKYYFLKMLELNLLSKCIMNNKPGYLKHKYLKI